MKTLQEEIQRARYILELEPNWDDEDATIYLEETFNKAVAFLEVLDEYCGSILVPKISHGPDGSIDILWDGEFFRLLVNIPENKPEFVFHGVREGVDIQGTINEIEPYCELIKWIMGI